MIFTTILTIILSTLLGGVVFILSKHSLIYKHYNGVDKLLFIVLNILIIFVAIPSVTLIVSCVMFSLINYWSIIVFILIALVIVGLLGKNGMLEVKEFIQEAFELKGKE